MESKDIVSIEKRGVSRNEYTIAWKMTYLYNYSCSFCIQGDRKTHIDRAKGENREIRGRIADRIVSFIETDLDQKAESLRIDLIGGEVLILPDFPDILERLLDARFHGVMKIGITTNLSCGEETLRALSALFVKRKNRKLMINCSFYKAYTDFESFYQKFSVLEKAGRPRLFNRLLKRGGPVRAAIGYPILDDADCRDFEAALKRHPLLKTRLRPIWIREYRTDVSPEAAKRILQTAAPKKPIQVSLADGSCRYIANMSEMSLLLGEGRMFDPAGCVCDVRNRFVNISPAGRLSGCPSEELCKVYTGDILTQNPEFTEKMEPCRIHRCGCTYFGRIERVTPEAGPR